jgi:NAD(P)-dependent dehydrogenase (short-subunit alcohol dehydrogenase family)
MPWQPGSRRSSYDVEVAGNPRTEQRRAYSESQMELDGQVAIITGAGRGIGRATALELGRMGANIVVAELDPANAERAAAEVRALGRRVLVVPTDVMSRKDLEGMVERTRAEFGWIDILVNNVGIYRAAKTLDVTEEHWDAVMKINAEAVFFASQAVLPTMIAQKRGVIVHLASMGGKVGSRANLPYNASKAAVIRASRWRMLPTGSASTACAPASSRPTCGRPSSRSWAPCSSNHPRSSPAAVSTRSRWGAWSGQKMSPT